MMTIEQRRQRRHESNVRYLETHADAVREGKRRYRQDNTETVRESHRRDYEKNRERYLAYQSLYRKANPEKRREWARTYRALDPERIREYMHKYEAENREKNEKTRQAWREAHPEVIREAHRKWARAHPDIARIKESRRRARKAGNGGSHTSAQWIALCWASGWRCLYCGRVLNETTAEQEHRIPIIRGGSDDIGNIAVSCRSCNRKKHTKTDGEFVALMAVGQ